MSAYGAGSLYVGNIDQKVDEELLWELFTQFSPLRNVYIPRDRVTKKHSGFGFIELKNKKDIDYVKMIANDLSIYEQKVIVKDTIKKRGELDYGANLFITGLSEEVTEETLIKIFGEFGSFTRRPLIIYDPKTGVSMGQAFIYYSDFSSSDKAIEVLNGKYIQNKKAKVEYAYKDEENRIKHGDKTERQLAKLKKKSLLNLDVSKLYSSSHHL